MGVIDDIQSLKFVNFLYELYGPGRIRFEVTTPEYFLGERVSVILDDERIGYLILEYPFDPNLGGFVSVVYRGRVPGVTDNIERDWPQAQKGAVWLEWINPNSKYRETGRMDKHTNIPFP